jgi:hypothetical protein
MVTIPFRAGPVLACTVKLTVPLPVSLAAPTIEIHGTFVAAVQAQVLPAVTFTVPDPPAPPNDPAMAES